MHRPIPYFQLALCACTWTGGNVVNGLSSSTTNSFWYAIFVVVALPSVFDAASILPSASATSAVSSSEPDQYVDWTKNDIVTDNDESEYENHSNDETLTSSSTPGPETTTFEDASLDHGTQYQDSSETSSAHTPQEASLVSSDRATPPETKHEDVDESTMIAGTLESRSDTPSPSPVVSNHTENSTSSSNTFEDDTPLDHDTHNQDASQNLSVHNPTEGTNHESPNDLITRTGTLSPEMQAKQAKESASSPVISYDSDLSGIMEHVTESEEDFISTTAVLISGESTIDDQLDPPQDKGQMSTDPNTKDIDNLVQSNVNWIGNDIVEISEIVGNNHDFVSDEGHSSTEANESELSQVEPHKTNDDKKLENTAIPSGTKSPDDVRDEIISFEDIVPDVVTHGPNETGLTDIVSVHTTTETVHPEAMRRSDNYSPPDEEGLNMESTEPSNEVFASALNEDHEPAGSHAPTATSLAALGGEPNGKIQNEHAMQKDPAELMPSSFDNLVTQQAHINALQELMADGDGDLESIDVGIYSGLPWGIAYEANRRVPDMELLYLFFSDRMSADASFHSRQHAEARFPLSMGHRDPDADEGDRENDLPGAQEDIDNLVQSSDKAVDALIGSLVKDLMDSSDLTLDDQGHILISVDAEDADGLRELFQGVDPPDELDVGAASGSSMQEFLMGKSKEIVFRRVSLGIKFVRRVLKTSKEKLKQRLARREERPKRTTVRFASDGNSASDDKPKRLGFITDRDWKADANSLWKVTQTAFQYVVRLFDKFLEGGEDDAEHEMVDALGEDMDLDVIRKMSGLKL